jgi:hypothetical protein
MNSMYIEVIKFDYDILIMKIGKTIQSCRNNKPLELKINRDRSKPLDLYSTLSGLQSPMVSHMHKAEQVTPMFYRFPDGQLPITRL